MLGRDLQPGEVVHHRNGDRKDNRRENLAVFPSQAEHMAEHRQQRQILTEAEVVTLILLGLYKREILARGISERHYNAARRHLGLPRKSRLVLTKLGRDTSRGGARRHIDYAQILALRAQGLTYREIGASLGCSHTGARYAFLRGGDQVL